MSRGKWINKGDWREKRNLGKLRKYGMIEVKRKGLWKEGFDWVRAWSVVDSKLDDDWRMFIGLIR